MSPRRSTSAVSCIECSGSIPPMCLASTRLQPKPSYARSAQMCPDSAIPPTLHPGWDSVLRTRLVVARCFIRRVVASGAALLLHYAWPRTRCITPKAMSASSFGPSTRKLGKPQAITATAHKLARIVYHLLSTEEPYNETVFHRCDEEVLRRARNLGSAERPLNSSFK
jgi:hypothetical protein